MKTVLDASAVMAVMFKEPGSDVVKPLMEGALISTVNLSEIYTKSVERGVLLEDAIFNIAKFKMDIIPFDYELAVVAASLRNTTRAYGCSSADRACLALAISRKATAVTADRAWLKIKTKAKVKLIR